MLLNDFIYPCSRCVISLKRSRVGNPALKWKIKEFSFGITSPFQQQIQDTDAMKLTSQVSLLTDTTEVGRRLLPDAVPFDSHKCMWAKSQDAPMLSGTSLGRHAHGVCWIHAKGLLLVLLFIQFACHASTVHSEQHSCNIGAEGPYHTQGEGPGQKVVVRVRHPITAVTSGAKCYDCDCVAHRWCHKKGDNNLEQLESPRWGQTNVHGQQ